MNDTRRFAYDPNARSHIDALLPLLPVELNHSGRRSRNLALVDSGAMVCVLPQSLGQSLGLVWSEAPPLPPLGGTLSRIEARRASIAITVDGFEAVPLEFAWAASDDVRLILGRVNFFHTFDVNFQGQDRIFDLTLR